MLLCARIFVLYPKENDVDDSNPHLLALNSKVTRKKRPLQAHRFSS